MQLFYSTRLHQDKSIDQSYRDIAFLLSIMHQYKQENSIAKLDNIISTNITSQC